jgi:hypothetical protein
MSAHRGRRNGRFGRLVIAATVACVVAPIAGEAVASAAPTSTPVSGDSRATAYPGNIHDGNSGNACSQLGFAGDTEIAVDGSGGYSAGGYAISSDGSNLTVTAIPDNTQIDALVVKGGDAYNVYSASAFTSLPASGLHAPMVGVNQDNVPTISHWFLCDGEPSDGPPPITVPATGSVSGNCSQAVVTIDAGSSDADVLIDPSGTGSAHHVAVTKDTESIVDIAVSAAHPTVTATDTATSTQLGTYTRPASCDSGTSDQGGVDPKVSFGTSCAHGIEVVLSNMKLDDTTTDPVTFTIVTPAGATDHVTVIADHIVRRFYNVTDGTTGVVTVSAPGLTTTSKSYAKKCTSVLGEKVTKKHPTVLGEKVTRLPFTGLPVWAMLSVAAALCLAGALMTQAGRRRPAVADMVMPGVPTLWRRTYPARGVVGRQ